MINIFVDTDIIIDFTHGNHSSLKRLLDLQRENKAELFVNPVVLAEFFTDQQLAEKKKLEKAYEFFHFFTVTEIQAKIGFLAGQLLREGITDYLGDAFIAATCITYAFQLATRNVKHFHDIPNLRLYEFSE